jgi:glutamine---fructose-6-phosphate transaminase (isomerizing)
MSLGSDAPGLAPFTNRIIYLDNGDWIVVDRSRVRFFGVDVCAVGRESKLTMVAIAETHKCDFRHYMDRELHEHTRAIGETLYRMVNFSTLALALPKLPFDIARIPRIMKSARGSAHYAGLVGRWWFEAIARIPTDRDIASEFRYRRPPLGQGELGLLVSRSGEAADTLAALRYMREQG